MKRGKNKTGFCLCLFGILCIAAGYPRETKESVTCTPVYMNFNEFRQSIKVTGPEPLRYPGLVRVQEDYIFLNELNRGIHIIDNSEPSKPRPVAFLHIPANADFIIKGNLLYADSGYDLLVLNISGVEKPPGLELKQRLKDILPYDPFNRLELEYPWLRIQFTARNAYEKGVVVDWIVTEAGTEKAEVRFLDSAAAGKRAGLESIASHFIFSGENLVYAGSQTVQIFSLNGQGLLNQKLKTSIAVGITSIDAHADQLYFGTMGNVYVYELTGNPVKIKRLAAIRCPETGYFNAIVSDGSYIYSQMRTGEDSGIISVMKIEADGKLRQLKDVEPMSRTAGMVLAGSRLYACSHNGVFSFSLENPQVMMPAGDFFGATLYSAEKYAFIPEFTHAVFYKGTVICSSSLGLYQVRFPGLGNGVSLSVLPIGGRQLKKD